MTEDTPIEPDTLDYDAEPEDEWLDEPEEELPRRPRHRLLGAGGNPIAVTLVAILLLAGAFYAGVEVEKGQTSSSTTAGLPSGLAALRSRLGASGAGASSTSGASGSSGAGSSAAGSSGFPAGAGRFFGGSGGGFPGAGGLAGGGVTTGEVSFANGNTLYVTSSEGNTVKVSAPAGTTVSKTVTTNVHGIHPGDTVVVRGTQNKNGSVSASSITISSSGGSGTSHSGSSTTGGGGLAQLFGG